ncbi:hypothetical protein EDC01DRAFT_713285, partial [Geopyxis carbonaria]
MEDATTNAMNDPRRVLTQPADGSSSSDGSSYETTPTKSTKLVKSTSPEAVLPISEENEVASTEEVPLEAVWPAELPVPPESVLKMLGIRVPPPGSRSEIGTTTTESKSPDSVSPASEPVDETATTATEPSATIGALEMPAPPKVALKTLEIRPPPPCTSRPSTASAASVLVEETAITTTDPASPESAATPSEPVNEPATTTTHKAAATIQLLTATTPVSPASVLSLLTRTDESSCESTPTKSTVRVVPVSPEAVLPECVSSAGEPVKEATTTSEPAKKPVSPVQDPVKEAPTTTEGPTASTTPPKTSVSPTCASPASASKAPPKPSPPPRYSPPSVWPPYTPSKPVPPPDLPVPPRSPQSLRLIFDPPLNLQRQIKIQKVLTALAKPYGLSTLLDVGCGGCELLKRLSPCLDALPLTLLSGVDVVAPPASVVETLQPGGYLGSGDASERWRGLTIEIMHGSFEALGRERRWDAIVSAEVIEHLDPEPLSRYGEVLLGRLRPKVAIVTTPNREFNALFDYLEEIQPQVTPKPRFYREGVDYGMRHDDHRFEWSRKEFRDWAEGEAEKWGYDVVFIGAGGGGEYGIIGDGEGPQVMIDALATIRGRKTIDAEIGDTPWFDIGLKDDALADSRSKEAAGPNSADFVCGPCTQIAVFVKRKNVKRTAKPTASYDPPPAALVPVSTSVFPFSTEPFPPSFATVITHICANRMLRWLPSIFSALHLLPDHAYHAVTAKPTAFLEKHAGSVEAEAMQRNNIAPWELHCVEVAVSLETLFLRLPALQRLCRDDLDVLERVLLAPSAVDDFRVRVIPGRVVSVRPPAREKAERRSIASWGPQRGDAAMPDLLQEMVYNLNARKQRLAPLNRLHHKPGLMRVEDTYGKRQLLMSFYPPIRSEPAPCEEPLDVNQVWDGAALGW